MKSSVHKSATLKSEEFYKVMKSKQKSISEKLNSALASQVQRNRKKLLFCFVGDKLLEGTGNLSSQQIQEFQRIAVFSNKNW